MKIETKFNIGDVLWFIDKRDNELACDKILFIRVDPEISYGFEDSFDVDEDVIDSNKAWEDSWIIFSESQKAIDYLLKISEEKENDNRNQE